MSSYIVYYFCSSSCFRERVIVSLLFLLFSMQESRGLRDWKWNEFLKENRGYILVISFVCVYVFCFILFYFRTFSFPTFQRMKPSRRIFIYLFFFTLEFQQIWQYLVPANAGLLSHALREQTCLTFSRNVCYKANTAND